MTCQQPILMFTSYAPELDECELTRQHMSDWRDANPTLSFRYYSDTAVDEFFHGLPWHESYSKLRTGVARADLFRACHIYIHGGYWFDIDMQPTCVQPLIDTAHRKSPLTFFDLGYKNLSYMLWGGSHSSPLVKRLCNEVCDRIDRHAHAATGKDILEITGPRVIQSIVAEIWGIEVRDGAFQPPPGGQFFRKGRYHFWYAPGPDIAIKSPYYREVQAQRSIRPYTESPHI